jgi:negative regulator of sigma E activity
MSAFGGKADIFNQKADVVHQGGIIQPTLARGGSGLLQSGRRSARRHPQAVQRQRRSMSRSVSSAQKRSTGSVPS